MEMAKIKYTALCFLFFISPAPLLAQTHIYLIGDSISNGYGQGGGLGQNAPILSAFATAAGISPSLITNAGFNGATTSDWVSRIDTILPFAPASSLFLIMLGTNDARIGPNGRSAGEWLFHAKNLVNKIKGAGHTALWNESPFITNGAVGWPVNPADKVLSYNANIPLTGAIEGDRSAWVYFRDHQELLPDKIHPDATGAQWLGQAWACALPAVNAPEPSTFLLCLMVAATAVTLLFAVLCFYAIISLMVKVSKLVKREVYRWRKSENEDYYGPF